MPRAVLILLSVLCTCLIAGCGSSRPQRSQIIIEDEAAVAAPAGSSAEPEPGTAAEPVVDPAAAAAVRGESVPSRIAITVVPGLGYSVGGERITLEELDRLLARIAKANRYADIQIRTHDNGTASLIQPVLDLTQRHRLVNVTLHDGR